MKKSRFTVDQIVGILREGDAGLAPGELTRKHGISEGTYYRWKAKYGGMEVQDARRLKQLDQENQRLKTMVADLLLENKVLKDINSRNW